MARLDHLFDEGWKVVENVFGEEQKPAVARVRARVEADAGHTTRLAVHGVAEAVVDAVFMPRKTRRATVADLLAERKRR